MGEASPSEQEREDQLQVVLSEYVSFPEQAHDAQSFQQVIDQAFDQANAQSTGKRHIWSLRSNDGASNVLSGVPGLRIMGF